MIDTSPPEFGVCLPNRTYVARPSVYTIITDESGRVAVLETPRGYFLPGGGVEPDESTEEAARRETREECGLELSRLRPVGTAVEYVYTDGHAEGIRKECTFFEGEFREAGGAATEPDHVLLWLEPVDAQRNLTFESQRWAVAEAILMRFARDL